MSLTIPADFPDVLAETVGPTFRNKTELKSVRPQFYKRKPNLLRELELSKEEKMDILGRSNDDIIAYESPIMTSEKINLNFRTTCISSWN